MNPFKRKQQSSASMPTESPVSRHEKHRKRGLSSISSTVVLLIAAPLLAVFITSHVFHSYEVDGHSMETTLHNGARLIVYKLPKTISNINGSTYMPSRRDIIVFDRPIQLSTSSNISHLIKRVIALPGERVVVKDGKVTVFNAESPEGFNPDDNQEYAKDITTTPGNVDITVGQGEVFVMGDNRTNSLDSRVFGAINTSTIVGNATIRFLPTSSMRKF